MILVVLLSDLNGLPSATQYNSGRHSYSEAKILICHYCISNLNQQEKFSQTIHSAKTEFVKTNITFLKIFSSLTTITFMCNTCMAQWTL